MNRPFIGLTARTLPLKAAGRTRPAETVARAYVEAVERAGGRPLIFPNAAPEEAPAYLDRVDGLLLTGGDDPHPRHFGEQPHPRIEAVDERRDLFEIALVREAFAREMAVLGLCRGVQILNIALGGDIYQDIESQAESALRHSQTRIDDRPWHEVEVVPGTLLAGLYGERRIRVNSFHHQACRRVPKDLLVSGTAVGDGLVEAVEAPGKRFVLGLQWHPELDPAEGSLFAAFVEAARESGRSASKER